MIASVGFTVFSFNQGSSWWLSLFWRKHRYNDVLWLEADVGLTVNLQCFCFVFRSLPSVRDSWGLTCLYSGLFLSPKTIRAPFRSVCSRWDLSHWQTEQTHSWGSSRALLSVGTVCLKSFFFWKKNSPASQSSALHQRFSVSKSFSLCRFLF